MWKTIKKFKKVVLTRLNNIKQKVIILSELTYGLKWDSINFMLGNCRLSTNNGENRVILTGHTTNNKTLELNTYNTKFELHSIELETFGTGTEIKLPTYANFFYISRSCAWDSHGIVWDVEIESTLGIYGVVNNNRFLIKQVFLPNDLWKGVASVFDECYDPDKPCRYESDGCKSLSYFIDIDSSSKYDYLVLRVESGSMWSDADWWDVTPVLIQYIDTSQELERTATDIHLIAWEES